VNFSDQSFLPKEAGSFSDMLGLSKFLRFGRPVAEAIKTTPEGKFVTNPISQLGAQGGNRTINMYGPEEIAAHQRKEIDARGSGSFPIDLLSGITNKLTPQSWGTKQKTQDFLYKMKNAVTNADTKAGSFVGGNNINSLRGKMFSVPSGEKGHGFKVGDAVNSDGSLSPLHEGVGTDRRPSVLAPIQNGMRVATPFLAATYVADKVFPKPDENAQENTQRVAFDFSSYVEKMAQKNITKSGENDIVNDEGIASDMEKKAMLQKTAELQMELEKTAALLKYAKEDNELLYKQAELERKAKDQVISELNNSKRDFLQKKAEHEEFRLRAIARERSSHAVKLAENMLGLGIIKQAQLDSQIDKLMECDEETFNLISSTAKQAAKGDEGLESLAVLSHYNNNDLESTSARPTPGLSKSGQTIGEAARDLNKLS
jgi:hypothetical protein